jgi:hypothetical protein
MGNPGLLLTDRTKVMKSLLKPVILATLAIISVTCSVGNKVPYRTSNVHIDDGEYLFYKGYIGGDNIYDLTLVSRYGNDPKWGKIINCFVYYQYLSYGEKQITDYKKFPEWYRISLLLCSSVAMHKDFHYLENNKDYKGPVSMDYSYDDKSSEVYYIEVDRKNGVDVISKSRIPIKKGFPFWDSSSSIFTPRFLDINESGIAYIFIPVLFKETVPFTLHALNHETTSTPAGTFKSIKCSFSVTDPFLAKLLDQMIRNSIIWIEDSPAKRLKKEKTAGGELILTAVSNVIK